MATETKKKGWPQVGSIRKYEDGTSYIKLADNVEILVDGQKIQLNDKRTLNLEKPAEKVKKMQDRGVIDEKTAEQRLAKLAEMPWLTHEIVARPPKTE